MESALREVLTPHFAIRSTTHPTAVPGSDAFVDPPLKTSDDVKRYGGIRIDAHVNIPQVVESAQFFFDVEIPNSPDDFVLPDFAALAKIDRLAIPGIAGLPDDIFLADLRASRAKDTKLNGVSELSAEFDGSITLLGHTFAAVGRLNLDLNQGPFGPMNLVPTATQSAAPNGVGESEAGMGVPLDPANGKPLLEFGNGFSISGDPVLLINATDNEQHLDHDGDVNTPAVDVRPNSGSLYFDGALHAGPVTVTGTFWL